MNKAERDREAVYRGLVSAIRTLTLLRIPGRDAATPASALGWFPFVGLLLGGIALLVMHGLKGLPLPLPAGLSALVLLGLTTYLTRSFHLDGLADWADAWWGGYDRERILAIMKDSHIGTFGVVMLTFDLLGKWVCYTHLILSGGGTWIAVSLILSRMGMVDLAVAQPYARSDGGTAARFVTEARARHWGLAVGSAGLMLLLWPGLTSVHAALGVAVTVLVTRLLGWRCRQRIGGITGDILGAGNELVELTALTLGVLLQAAPTA